MATTATITATTTTAKLTHLYQHYGYLSCDCGMDSKHSLESGGMDSRFYLRGSFSQKGCLHSRLLRLTPPSASSVSARSAATESTAEGRGGPNAAIIVAREGGGGGGGGGAGGSEGWGEGQVREGRPVANHATGSPHLWHLSQDIWWKESQQRKPTPPTPLIRQSAKGTQRGPRDAQESAIFQTRGRLTRMR